MNLIQLSRTRVATKLSLSLSTARILSLSLFHSVLFRNICHGGRLITAAIYQNTELSRITLPKSAFPPTKYVTQIKVGNKY